MEFYAHFLGHFCKKNINPQKSYIISTRYNNTLTNTPESKYFPLDNLQCLGTCANILQFTDYYLKLYLPKNVKHVTQYSNFFKCKTLSRYF